MDLEKLNSLEDRIQKPGYLLLLVTVLLFLIIGLVNMIDYTSANPRLFGRYSVPYSGLLLIYTAVTLLWTSLLRRPNDDSRLKVGLTFIQKRSLLALALFAAFAAIVLSLLSYEEWLNFPALQTTVIVLITISAGFLLFYRWGDRSLPQLWRKLIVYPAAILIVVELLVQLSTVAGIIPNINDNRDHFAPFSRIYQTEEGFRNGTANSDGWNYPEFNLYPDSYRILLFGDSFIQALQIAPEENLGVVLQGLLDEELPEGELIEVLAIGNPDFGPGLYLNPPMIDFAIEAYEPDEVIAFFDLGSDFQLIDAPDPENVEMYFFINEDGEVEIHEESFWLRHRYQHQVLFAYEGFQPNRFLRSMYLTPQVLQNFLGGAEVSASVDIAGATADIDLPNGFVFDPAQNDEAVAIAAGHVKIAAAHLSAQGIPMSLVTIPVFTDEFLAQGSWNSQFGESDLLLPEAELREFAAENDIPFLGLGAFMFANGVTPDEVQSLYFANGRGHFTPAGHQFAAAAVYSCFFAETVAADAGCDAR